MVTFDHIKGGTFELLMKLEHDEQPQAIGGWSIESQLRTMTGELVADLNVVITSATEGKFVISHPASGQDNWPAGDLQGDMKITRPDGTVLPSQPFRVRVFGEITM